MTHLHLLSLDWLRDGGRDPRTTLGHASLLAQLSMEADIAVTSQRMAVNAAGFSQRRFFDALWRALGPDSVLAIGVYVWNEAIVQWLLPRLRARGFAGRIVLGGPQISYASAGVGALYPAADVFVRGYGETALVSVLRGQTVQGVSLQGGPDVACATQVDLEALPSPLLTGVMPLTPFMRWETQRGCIYGCRFCQHREAGARLAQRNLAWDRVAAELDVMVAHGVRDIAVLDPIFDQGTHAVAVLRRFVQRGYRGRLSLQCRFETISEALLEVCQDLDVLLEFGLQTVVPSEMRASGRMNDLVKVERTLERLFRRGIPFEVSLIHGLPTQTLASFEHSVGWCLDRGVLRLRAFPLMLLRGTPMSEQRDKLKMHRMAAALMRQADALKGAA